MLITDTRELLKTALAKKGTTMTTLAERCGMLPGNVSRDAAKNPINKNFIKMFETLGYDIKLTITLRKSKTENKKTAP